MIFILSFVDEMIEFMKFVMSVLRACTLCDWEYNPDICLLIVYILKDIPLHTIDDSSIFTSIFDHLFKIILTDFWIFS